MLNDSTIHDYLKKYFGFDTFKGNQEPIIRNVLARTGYFCANAYRRRQIALLSAACSNEEGDRNSYITAYCTNEKSG